MPKKEIKVPPTIEGLVEASEGFVKNLTPADQAIFKRIKARVKEKAQIGAHPTVIDSLAPTVCMRAYHPLKAALTKLAPDHDSAKKPLNIFWPTCGTLMLLPLVDMLCDELNIAYQVVAIDADIRTLTSFTGTFQPFKNGKVILCDGLICSSLSNPAKAKSDLVKLFVENKVPPMAFDLTISAHPPIDTWVDDGSLLAFLNGILPFVSKEKATLFVATHCPEEMASLFWALNAAQETWALNATQGKQQGCQFDRLTTKHLFSGLPSKPSRKDLATCADKLAEASLVTQNPLPPAYSSFLRSPADRSGAPHGLGIAVNYHATIAIAGDDALPVLIAECSFKKATDLFEKQQYNNAFKVIQPVRKIINRCEYAFLAAQCLEKLRKPGKAAVILSKLLSKNPENPQYQELMQACTRTAASAPVAGAEPTTPDITGAAPSAAGLTQRRPQPQVSEEPGDKAREAMSTAKRTP
jgi:hypothetical protein